MSKVDWQNRITGYGTEDPEQLLGNPLNYRRHGGDQQEAMKAILDDVGFVREVIVNKTTGHIVDGHMRVEIAMREGATEIPVSYVELSPEEERKALATFDPIAGLAMTDQSRMHKLTGRIGTMSEALEAIISRASERKPGGDDLPKGIEDSKTRESALDTYENSTVRQIHFPLLQNEYAEVSAAVKDIGDRIKAERNADVLFWLIDQDAKAKGYTWRQ